MKFGAQSRLIRSQWSEIDQINLEYCIKSQFTNMLIFLVYIYRIKMIHSKFDHVTYYTFYMYMFRWILLVLSKLIPLYFLNVKLFTFLLKINFGRYVTTDFVIGKLRKSKIKFITTDWVIR